MYHYVRDWRARRMRGRPPSSSASSTTSQRATRRHPRRASSSRGLARQRRACSTFDDGLVEHLAVVRAGARAPRPDRRVLPAGRGRRRAPPARRAEDAVPARVVDDHEALGAARSSRVSTTPRRFGREHAPAPLRPAGDGVREAGASRTGCRSRAAPRVLDALFREHRDRRRARVRRRASTSTADQCRELVARGHEVIGHGWAHRRLGLLDEATQRDELERDARVRRVRRRHLGALLPVRQPRRDDARAAPRARLRGRPHDRAAPRDARDPLLELPRIDTNDLQLEVVQVAGVDGPVAEPA